MGVKEERLVYINKWRGIKDEEYEGEWNKMAMNVLNSLDEPHYTILNNYFNNVIMNIKTIKEQLYHTLRICDPLDTGRKIQLANNNIESLTDDCFYYFEKYLYKEGLVSKNE